MIVRSVLARVALLFPHRKVSRVWPHVYQNARSVFHRCEIPTTLGASSLMAPSSRVWMSTSSNEDKEVTSRNRVNISTSGESNQQQATRAMFLGNVFPILAGTAAIALGGIALALGLLYVKQDNLLYIPEMDGIVRQNELNPPGYKSPAEYNIPFETHMIPTRDGNTAIHSWLLLHPRSKQDNLPTIMFFHGNAG